MKRWMSITILDCHTWLICHIRLIVMNLELKQTLISDPLFTWYTIHVFTFDILSTWLSYLACAIEAYIDNRQLKELLKSWTATCHLESHEDDTWKILWY